MKRVAYFLLTAMCAVSVFTSCSKYDPAKTVTIDINDKRQTMEGIGSSLTESSAFVLACVDSATRHQILLDLFGEQGANFPLSRTQIGASDFTVEGNYTLDDVAGDTALVYFSLDPDKAGFSKEKYPDIVDENYDLYQLIKEVQSIKNAQRDSRFNMVAASWTAPAWMKDNGKFYDKENRTGGRLLPEYYQTFANYLAKYVKTYRSEGVNIWAISPENEPQGNDGSWESMHFTPQEEAYFIGRYLGPTFEREGLSDVLILGFDQNTFESGPWAAAIYGDSLANKYTAGLALHWYGSTVIPFAGVMDSLHNLYPDKRLLHTEGCIDNLGCDAWPGVQDPEGYKESGWFKNDEFWTTPSATDWAYSTQWWPDWHPKYAPVHRYGRYIIEGMNSWLESFIDWNCVLSSIGGPNHVGNLCGAPIMIDTETKEVYYTPVFYALKTLSNVIRPGDVALGVAQAPEFKENLFVSAVLKPDGSVGVCALNTDCKDLNITLLVGDKPTSVTIPANSVYGIVLPAAE